MTDPVSGNTISNNTIHHNQMAGIKVKDSGLNILAGNIIHDNGSSGIWLSGAMATHNMIGGGAIYANGAAGITEGEGADKNTWVTMSMYANFGLGIDKGDNGLVDAPPLTIAAITTVDGFATVIGTYTGAMDVSLLYRVDLYRLARDASGYGEGRTYVGSRTLSSALAPTVNTQQIIDAAGAGCYTAVVTVINPSNSAANHSSEFSKNLICQAYLPLMVK